MTDLLRLKKKSVRVIWGGVTMTEDNDRKKTIFEEAEKINDIFPANFIFQVAKDPL